jgi:predicted O-methyltransferase YrrM
VIYTPTLLRKAIQTLAVEGPRTTLAKTRERTRFARDTVKASRRLRTMSTSDPSGIGESLDFAFDFRIGEVTIAPAQIRTEIESLLRTLAEDPPERILEIGTARGGTLFLLSRVARVRAVLVSVDLPEGAFGGTYRRESILLLKAIPLAGQTLQLIRGNSHDSPTFHAVREAFGGNRLDLLLIDGDHRYEGVRNDFAMYGPLVRPGGLIAIHDIVPGAREHVGGVPRFWQEVKNAHRSSEFVSNWHQQGFGIGVVRVPPEGLSATLLGHQPRG